MAVLAVVAYHCHVGWLGGGYVGVDVFFVISGFLITDHLWRELGAEGHLSFSAFYRRRARRLLPAGMLVVVVTAAASAVWLPPLQTRTVWKDGLASALYVGNYRFALTRTDYLASTLPSPFQHFWSLGVEEQFYLVWPVLLVAGALAWRRGAPSRGSVTACIALVAAGSFAFSYWLTGANQPWAFFSLPSRAWELAAGGLVALGVAPGRRRVPPAAAAALGWLGLGAIAWSAIAFSPFTPFPGSAALVPVLGAAAVIGAGIGRPAAGPVVLLGRPLMQGIGRISYSWYLWHWPVVILAPYMAGRAALAEWQYLGLGLGSAGLATLTYFCVERPVQRSAWLTAQPWRTYALGTSLTGAGVVACVLAVSSLPPLTGAGRAPVAAIRIPPTTAAPLARRPAVAGPDPTPLARRPDPALVAFDAAQAQVVAALRRSASATRVPANLDPPLGQASASESAPDVDGCLLSFLATEQPPCLFGATASTDSVVLFGDSHATMWFPAVDRYANAQHLALRVWTKATCPPIQLSIYTPELGRQFTECDEWKQSVLAHILSLRPKLVVLGMAPNYDLAYHIVQDSPQWLRGLAGMIHAIRQSGAQVVVMGPVPSPNTYIANCLSAHLTDMPACAVRSTGGADGPGLFGYDTAGMIAERAAVAQAGAWFVDVKPWFCAAVCPPVVDNLLVYRDNSHITVPYVEYLAPLVADQLSLARRAGR